MDLKDLKNRLEQSERKRIQLQKRLARKSIEEDIPLWSMVDLMTLLLVFFLLLYSLTAKDMLSSSHNSKNDRPVKIDRGASFHPKDIKRVDPSHIVQSFEGYAHLRQDTPKNRPVVSIERPSCVLARDDKSVGKPYSTQTPGLHPLEKDDNLDVSIKQLKKEVLNIVGESDKDVFSIRRDRNRIVVVLGERITFRVGEATLLDIYRPIFKGIVRLIISKPEYRVVVSGHTDNTPICTEKFPSNWELSASRAASVVRFFQKDMGINPKNLEAVGRSFYDPIAPNETREGRAMNRRVNIIIAPKIE